MNVVVLIVAVSLGLGLFFLPIIGEKFWRSKSPTPHSNQHSSKNPYIQNPNKASANTEEAEVMLIDLLHLTDNQDFHTFKTCIHPDQKSKENEYYKRIKSLMAFCRNAVPQDLDFDHAHDFQVAPGKEIAINYESLVRVKLIYCNPQEECIKESFQFDFKLYGHEYLLWEIDDSAIF